MSELANIALVPVGEDLDVTTVPGVRETIDSLIDGGCRRIVLNLASTTYIDSAGMGLVVSAVRRMHEHRGLLSLTNVSGEVKRALVRARIVDFVPVSSGGDRGPVSSLDPQALPEWRTAFRIDPTNLAATRQHLGLLVDRMQFTPDDAFDLMLAVGEAIGNAVDHADGCSLVEVACYADRAVVEVSDCGEGFEAQSVPAPCDRFAERGRGIALMQLLADSVTIAPKPSGTGTAVRIVKLF